MSTRRTRIQPWRHEQSNLDPWMDGEAVEETVRDSGIALLGLGPIDEDV